METVVSTDRKAKEIEEGVKILRNNMADANVSSHRWLVGA
jgi:hypothetical protein